MPKPFKPAVMANRVTALNHAAEVLGEPTKYRSTHTRKGEPQSANGIAGAIGATKPGDSSTLDSNDYADSLLTLARYITGEDNQ